MHPINRLVGKTGYFIKNARSSYLDFDSLVLSLSQRKGRLNFVQIGANDGVTADPIYHLLPMVSEPVRGLLIEPVTEYFNELSNNYSKYRGIDVLRTAIHPTARHLTIFFPSVLSRQNSGLLAKGIASADPEHWRKSSYLQDESELDSEVVPAMSINRLLETIDWPVDLLLVDTEGMDFEILMDLDLAKFQIEAIRFEHGLKDAIMTPAEVRRLVQKLNKNDFQVFLEPYDGVAVKLDTQSLVESQ